MSGLIFLAAALAAPNWVPVANSGTGPALYAEAESLAAAKPNQSNRVWVKLAVPAGGGVPRTEITGLELIDCEARSYQVLQSSVSWPDLGQGGVEHGPEPVRYITPGSEPSPSSILIDRICG
jgi:hypothetical protein